MKRFTALILTLLLLSAYCCTGAEGEWVCPNCGENATKNFCCNCGMARSVETGDEEEAFYQNPVKPSSPLQEDAAVPEESPTDTPLQSSVPEDVDHAEWKIGDTVTFGTYPQTSEGNDHTPIEWIVLNVEDGKALLISKYTLDAMPYTIDWDANYTTWESCTLRQWLNDTFSMRAFGKEEKTSILLTPITPDRNPNYSADPGSETTDQVFILSIEEANKYFNSNSSRQCIPTEYARYTCAVYQSQTAIIDGTGACWWYLRSPGSNGHYVSYVNGGGAIETYGTDIHGTGDGYYAGVRPCIWVKIDLISLVSGSKNAADSTLTTEESENEQTGVSIGSTVIFGTYPQSASGNDNTPIEWIILDIQDDRALMLSKYVIDAAAYNDQYVSVTWETCSLRAWLNEQLIDVAFSKEEQKYIVTTYNRNPDNTLFGTSGGNDTEDMVFLLSYDEVIRYIENGLNRICIATEYAKSRGVFDTAYNIADGKKACKWWLRSPGAHSNESMLIWDGSVNVYGFTVDISDIGVRPSIWVRLDAITE